MAIAGNARINRKLTTRVIQVKTGSLIIVMPGALMLMMVVMKLIAPKMDEAPDKCKAKIAKSTEGPE